MFSNSDFFHSFNFFSYLKPLSMYNIFRSRSGSNQPKALSIASHEGWHAQGKRKLKPIKKKLGLPKKKGIDIQKVPLDSPLMGTRSETGLPSSPATSTRSKKKRLSLWFLICILNSLVVCESNVCFKSHFLCDLTYVRLKLWWICEQFMCQPMVNCNAFVQFLCIW